MGDASQWGHGWLAQATELPMKSLGVICELPASRVPSGGYFSEFQSHPLRDFTFQPCKTGLMQLSFCSAYYLFNCVFGFNLEIEVQNGLRIVIPSINCPSRMSSENKVRQSDSSAAAISNES